LTRSGHFDFRIISITHDLLLWGGDAIWSGVSTAELFAELKQREVQNAAE